MRRNVLDAILLLASFAVIAAGCGRGLAPVEPRRGATSAMSPGAGLAIEPGPQQPAPPEDGSPTAVPCPSARITVPAPSRFFPPVLTPTFTFHWAPNIPAPPGPVPSRYRYRVFDENGTDFDFVQLLVDPQSVIRTYAPTFTGWTEVSSAVTEATINDMDPDHAHVLVLIAMDAHGRFDNVVSFERNALYFHVSPALVMDADRGTR